MMFLNNLFEKCIRFRILNPKVLSVANSCDYNEMAKIVYRQMPAPRDLPPKSPPPPARVRMQKPPTVEANFQCKSPGVRGGIVMAKIDSCITRCINAFDKTLIDTNLS